MLIYLVGVLEDGAIRADFLPQNPRKAVRVQKGADVTIRVQVFHANGTKADLRTGAASLALQVKRKSSDVPPLIAKAATLTAAADGVGEFTFTPSDTLSTNIPPAVYVYDVWLTQSGKRDAVVPISPFIIEPAVQLP
jgi:hypothetical protein